MIDLPPTRYDVGPIVAYRSNAGYGWEINVGRFQWRTRRGTTRMWPHVAQGTDEHCNRSIYAVLWPLGTLTVWWEPRWRSTRCDKCRAQSRAWGCCE